MSTSPKLLAKEAVRSGSHRDKTPKKHFLKGDFNTMQNSPMKLIKSGATPHSGRSSSSKQVWSGQAKSNTNDMGSGRHSKVSKKSNMKPNRMQHYLSN